MLGCKVFYLCSWWSLVPLGHLHFHMVMGWSDVTLDKLNRWLCGDAKVFVYIKKYFAHTHAYNSVGASFNICFHYIKLNVSCHNSESSIIFSLQLCLSHVWWHFTNSISDIFRRKGISQQTFTDHSLKKKFTEHSNLHVFSTVPQRIFSSKEHICKFFLGKEC